MNKQHVVSQLSPYPRSCWCSSSHSSQWKSIGNSKAQQRSLICYELASLGHLRIFLPVFKRQKGKTSHKLPIFSNPGSDDATLLFQRSSNGLKLPIAQDHTFNPSFPTRCGSKICSLLSTWNVPKQTCASWCVSKNELNQTTFRPLNLSLL